MRAASATTRPSASRIAQAAEALARPGAEYADLLRRPLFWGWGVRRGDGHAVLVLPGLGAGDAYLTTLRDWLRRVGYRPLRSGIEINRGWSAELVERLGQVVLDAYAESGRPVTIVGHSMGGVIGRSVAIRHPEAVRQVITLGSPLRFSRTPLPASVSITAIASRDDRVVGLEGAGHRDSHGRTIEVRGSHTGLAWNAEVYRLLGQLLPANASVRA